MNGRNSVKRAIFTATFLLFSLQLIWAQDDARSPEAGQAYNDGLNLVRKGKYEQAIPKFNDAVKADDNFPNAHYMLGYCYKKKNNFSAAEKEYRQAIKLNSKFEKAYEALGNLHAQSANTSEAINTFNALLVINANNAKANFGLGKIYYDQKKYTDAADKLEKAVATQSKYVAAHNILGMTYKNMRKFSNSVTAFESAIKYEKKNSKKGTYYYQLGQVQIEAKQYKAAEAALLNALKFSRNSSVVAGSNFYLGEVYKLTNRNQKALKFFERATKNNRWKQAAEYEIDLIKNPDKYVR